VYIARANLQLISQAMHYRSVKGFTGWGQLGILILFLGVGFVIAGIIQLGIGMQMIPAGVTLDQMTEAVTKAMVDPANVGYARLSQVLGTLCIMFIPAVLYLIVCHGKNPFWLGFNKHINAKQVILGFFLIFLANIIAAPLADLSKMILSNFPDWNLKAQRMEDAYSKLAVALSNLKSWPEFFMAIFIMAFFPALFEEIFFRGALQNLFERWWKAPMLAVIITSLLFSLIHMSLYLFLSRALLGFVLGLMYQRSRNIWVNVVAHFLNNVVAVIQLFWISRNKESIELDKLDVKAPLWVALIAVAITIGLFILFERVSAKNRKQIAFEEQDLLENSDILNPFPGKNV